MPLFRLVSFFGKLLGRGSDARESARKLPPIHDIDLTKDWLTLTEEELPENVGQLGLGGMLNPISRQVTPTIFSDDKLIALMLKKAGLSTDLARYIEHAGWIILTDRSDSNRINIHVSCFRDASQLEALLSSSKRLPPGKFCFPKGPLLVCMDYEGETRHAVFDAIKQTLINRDYPN